MQEKQGNSSSKGEFEKKKKNLKKQRGSGVTEKKIIFPLCDPKVSLDDLLLHSCLSLSLSLSLSLLAFQYRLHVSICTRAFTVTRMRPPPLSSPPAAEEEGGAGAGSSGAAPPLPPTRRRRGCFPLLPPLLGRLASGDKALPFSSQSVCFPRGWPGKVERGKRGGKRRRERARGKGKGDEREKERRERSREKSSSSFFFFLFPPFFLFFFDSSYPSQPRARPGARPPSSPRGQTCALPGRRRGLWAFFGGRKGVEAREGRLFSSSSSSRSRKAKRVMRRKEANFFFSLARSLFFFSLYSPSFYFFIRLSFFLFLSHFSDLQLSIDGGENKKKGEGRGGEGGLFFLKRES